jgi:hypothetical protein
LFDVRFIYCEEARDSPHLSFTGTGTGTGIGGTLQRYTLQPLDIKTAFLVNAALEETVLVHEPVYDHIYMLKLLTIF